MIDDTEFLFIYLYNANTENDQLTTFLELTNLLENLDLTKNKPVIFADDFNLFLDWSLEAKGGNLCLKKQSLSKLLQIKEKLNLCDIWRIRNTKVKQYTFRQQYLSRFSQRRLDCIFISQNFQEIFQLNTHKFLTQSAQTIPLFYVHFKTRNGSRTAAASKVDLFMIIVNGCRPLTIIRKSSTLDVGCPRSASENFNQCHRGPGFWKINNSLVSNEEYVLRLKELIYKVKEELNRNNQFCDQALK